MLKKFKEHIDSELEFLKKGKILLAISGGMDSVVLAHLCKKSDLTFSLAHCNFNLRGEESDEDEVFIEELAEKWELELFVQHFQTKKYAKTQKLSTQMAARELRYHWFGELADQLEFNYILTAHHADDNLETFLINLSRGSGLDGLTGIPETNGKIVRPLLHFSREEIQVYAIENELKWRVDSSNASTDYLRNKLRHDVIPTLKNMNPSFLDNFKDSISHLSDVRAIVKDRIDEVTAKIISNIQGDEVKFNIKELLKLNNTNIYVYQLLKEYGFTQWNDIFDLLHSQSGKQIYSDGFRLIKNRDHLILTSRTNGDSDKIFTIDDVYNQEYEFNGLTLKIEEAQEIVKSNSNNIISVDREALQLPLTIRRWKKGDYFYPFGLGGKKKLSKYFKDEKFSAIEKENIWLLCSGDKIVWVIGKRMDDRFKVHDGTNNILQIEVI